MKELLFPSNINCIFCELPIDRQNTFSMCKKCYSSVDFIYEICPECGRSGDNSSLCTNCHGEYYYFDCIFSAIKYNDFIHKQIYKYKYGQKTFMSVYFAQILSEFIKVNRIKFDYITGVPISKKRLNQRGFNQTYLIAEKIPSMVGIGKFIEMFNRIVNTTFLSKLSNIERIREVENVFELKSDAIDFIIQEKYNSNDLHPTIKILLIDDIFTTGSTVNELSKILKKSIANVDITVLTLCNARKFKI